MPDVPHPEKEKLVTDFLDRTFLAPGRTILGQPHLDIRRPSLHDTKVEFLSEFRFVSKSAKEVFALYSGMLSHGEISIEDARGIPMDFSVWAAGRGKGQPMKSPSDLIMHNIRNVDYWGISKRLVFDLYLNFAKRLTDLEEQRDLYWSAKGRPPDHYARAIALRYAKLFAKEFKRMPTIGTASYSDHASTEYGRGLEELFSILEISTGFRLPGEWAISQLAEASLPDDGQTAKVKLGLLPNLLGWPTQKSKR